MSEQPKSLPFDRDAMWDLLTRRFFYILSFEIYRGTKGLYDLGPPGCAIQNNLLQSWRNFFIIEEGMLEIDSTCLTSEPVLQASGHCDKFDDFMVKDMKTGDCYRADHLLEEHMDHLIAQKDTTEEQKKEYELIKAKADAYSLDELKEILRRFKPIFPGTKKNPISDPFSFNLMFSTQIGPKGNEKGFLRPELAQGIFVNFRRLYEFGGSKLPFAAACVGRAFRNEISPRSRLLRVREFTLAEIEHFLNPNEKSHPKFASVSSIQLPLLPRESQEKGLPPSSTAIGDAVKCGMVSNETLGYFMVRVFLFLTSAGVTPSRLRFRQHLSNEMAHYAQDCWDAEIETSYGWVECVGIADRAAFDLSCHSGASGQDLRAFILFKDGVKDMEVTEMEIKRPVIGKTFRGAAKQVLASLELSQKDSKECEILAKEMEEKGSITVADQKLTPDMVKFKKVTKRVAGESITPSVVEPSFGIGRILYCILEHTYRRRPGSEARGYFSLPPNIAPVKCSILPLQNDAKFAPLVGEIAKKLRRAGISVKVDDAGTASIGRRYSRTDEIGIPFGITVDYQSLEDKTVTLRERDSMKQVRLNVEGLEDVVTSLIRAHVNFSVLVEKHGEFSSTAEEK